MRNAHQASERSECETCPIFASCLFAEYCDSGQQGMATGLVGRINHYPRGGYLGYNHEEEEFVYIIRSGLVRNVVCWPTGGTSTFCMYGPRTVLALYEPFVKGSPPYLLECLVPVEVCVLRRDVLLRLAERSPSLSLHITCSMAVLFGPIAAYHRMLEQSHIQDRIRLLLALLQEMGEPVAQGISLTQELIAELVCSDPRSVRRALRQLRQEGCLLTSYGNVKVVGELSDDDASVFVRFVPRGAKMGA